MQVYLIRHEDHSPNALRSTSVRSDYYMQKTEPRGNSGNHPVITDGWLGTTNDQCLTAMGAFDLDTDQEQLAEMLADCNIGTTVDDIMQWADGLDDELVLTIADPYTYTKSCKYNLGITIMNDGWQCLDSYMPMAVMGMRVFGAG